ncbi:polyadenylate-binding protein-interacting protein 2B [Elgaria multicarinata webbii]|uniref:polyadenylate-binding protein-interacting protein 2B n=1 Tax=Elgaria multicarinata webbii TaxID=159646 RepID=UPI002FCCF31E
MAWARPRAERVREREPRGESGVRVVAEAAEQAGGAAARQAGAGQAGSSAERGARGPARPTADSIMMNGSNVANTTTTATPPAKSKEDQVVNGHDEKENNPFAEYMWMENEEDFNRQVEEELQEQEFLDRCFQEMLDEEDQDWFIPSRDLPQGVGQLQQQLNGLSVNENTHSHVSEDILSKSTLNPDAKEFVPGVKY